MDIQGQEDVEEVQQVIDSNSSPEHRSGKLKQTLIYLCPQPVTSYTSQQDPYEHSPDDRRTWNCGSTGESGLLLNWGQKDGQEDQCQNQVESLEIYG